MRDGEPIGFAGENSPEIAEISLAIKEADEWIESDRQDIDDLETRIQIEEESTAYAAEHDLKIPDVSIDDLKKKLEGAKINLQKDLDLKEELIGVQRDFQTLDWQQNIQEIRMKHFLENNPSKTVD